MPSSACRALEETAAARSPYPLGGQILATYDSATSGTGFQQGDVPIPSLFANLPSQDLAFTFYSDSGDQLLLTDIYAPEPACLILIAPAMLLIRRPLRRGVKMIPQQHRKA